MAAMHGFDVEVEGKIPVLLRAFEHRALVHVARHIGENIERAEFLGDCLRKCIDVFCRQHVELHAFCGFKTLQFIDGDIGCDHLSPFRDECLSDRTADALASRSDECQFSFQSVAHGFDFP